MTVESGDACDLLCLDLPNAERLRAALPSVTRAERASGFARAFGEPIRLRLAAALLLGDELCVCDLAWVVGGSQALVSHHLRLLKVAGVVVSRRDGRMVMYRLVERGRAVLSVLLDVDDAPSAGRVVEGADHG